MIEQQIDLFDLPKNTWRCVTTNQMICANGKAVMGAGIAKIIRDNYVGIDELLGKYINSYGNRCFVFKHIKWISFPTKYHWKDPSDIHLIRKSSKELMEIIDKFNIEKVYLPRPGCGMGQLDWEIVKANIENILDDRVTVCYN